MNKRLALTLALTSALAIAACGDTDASVASSNLSKAAEQFEIVRKITFINGITDSSPMEIQGRCSITADGMDKQLEVTCKTDSGQFVKHFLGLSDNMTYVVEQLEPAAASTAQYRFIVKPSAILPDVDLQ